MPGTPWLICPMLYADPRACPWCRSEISPQSPTCPACDLHLRDPLAAQVFAALRRVDVLVGDLRTRSAVPPEPEAAPRPAAPAQTRSGVRTASVPGILLGLGALCLLVAAVTFLVFAWTWLGIGGRTVVLLALSGTAAGLSQWFSGRRLRVAAESLACVTLGLVALDTTGAIHAGWLGALDSPGRLVAIGAALAVGAVGLLARTPRLVSAQAGLVVAADVVAVGLSGLTAHVHPVLVGTVLGLAALAAVARRCSAHVTFAGAVASALLAWLTLAADAAGEVLSHLDLAALWQHGHGYAALAAALLPLLGAVPGADRVLRVGAAGLSATLLTLLVAAPTLDERPTTLAVVAVAVLTAWSVAAVVRPVVRAVALGPLACGAVVALDMLADVVVAAQTRLGEVGEPFGRSVSVGVTGAAPEVAAWLAPLLVLSLMLAAAAVSPSTRTLPWELPAGLLALTATLTLASYDVPLAAVVAVPVAVGLALAVVRRDAAAPLLAVGCFLALPSAGLTAIAAGVAVASGVLLMRPGRWTGELVVPAAAALLLEALASVAHVDPSLRGYPVLVVLGALAIWRPVPVLEVTAAACAVLASQGAVMSAADPQTALAIHLTVAGALVVATSVIHPARRDLAWPGGLLLAAATWVRLADLGVTAPEPYTLPSGVALVLVALDRLRRDAEAPTRLLVPGLSLATVPSLLWVLDQPTGPRVALLGAGCLALVLVGVRLRWSAPLLVGSTVGAVLVLRLLAPYAGTTPPWALIGLTGTLLTVVGVTWEQRLVELRRAAAYVGRLR